jgi:hypothetical protein
VYICVLVITYTCEYSVTTLSSVEIVQLNPLVLQNHTFVALCPILEGDTVLLDMVSDNMVQAHNLHLPSSICLLEPEIQPH